MKKSQRTNPASEHILDDINYQTPSKPPGRQQREQGVEVHAVEIKTPLKRVNPSKNTNKSTRSAYIAQSTNS